MKKSSKILGSVALSAALAMGTAVPAFAATPGNELAFGGAEKNYSTSGTDALIDQESGASTIVTVSTYTSQLSVTVPLYLPIWLDTAGQASYAPNNYSISNGSPIDITVESAEYTAVHPTLKPGTETSLPGVSNKYNIKIANKVADGQAAVGDTFDMNGTNAVSGKADTYVQGDLGWVIGKVQNNTATVFPLSVTAKSSKLTSRYSDEKLATIIYTVKAGSESAKPQMGTNASDTTQYVDATKEYPTKSVVVTAANGAYDASDADAAVNAVKAIFTGMGFENVTVNVVNASDAATTWTSGSVTSSSVTMKMEVGSNTVSSEAPVGNGVAKDTAVVITLKLA